LVTLAGVVGFYTIFVAYSPDPSSQSLFDALYYAVITLTTVGYGDSMGLLDLPQPGRLISEVFTVVYILVAYGVVLWTSSLVIAYLVEGSLSETLFRRRNLRRIRMLENHFVLCGVGRTGAEIASEFAKTGMPLVVIDVSLDYLEPLDGLGGDHLAVLQGDATNEDILEQAGIHGARGLIANLDSDPENLFLTMTAKAMNPDLRVIAGAVDQKNRDKLIRAGADGVVFPWQIGALRLASEMIRPTVVSFLDRMLRDPSRQVRVSEVGVAENSELDGITIEASQIYERTGLLVVAIHKPDEHRDHFHYNPAGSHVIQGGETLVVIGEKAQVDELSRLCRNR
jgi:voltage-gated potassium channel